MSSKSLKDIVDSHIFLQEDSNGREIKYYIVEDCQFEKNKIFYPEVFLYSHIDRNFYNPMNEKVMSLEKLSVKKEYEFSLEKNVSVETTPVFYFLYNTENYFHFIYDSLPYLITYFELKKREKRLKLLINFPNQQTNKLYKFVQEFYEILGLNENDIIYVNNKSIYKKMYISSSYTHGIDSNLPPRKEIYSFYENLVKSNSKKYSKDTPEKIYISRRSWIHKDYSNIGTNYTLKRKMINENELVTLLKKHNYVEIFTEKLDTVEKLNLFYNCEHIVGAIGGGLCNVLFSKPESKLLSIVSPTFLDVNYRFKYSLDNVNTTYFHNTNHVEIGSLKTGMRIECRDLSLVGEIVNVYEKNVEVIYSDDAVSGWNNQIEFKKIILPFESCIKLDEGLNSPFEVDLSKISDIIF